MATSTDTLVQGEGEKKAEQQQQGSVKPDAPAVKLEGVELMEAIRKQVEYYFSRENLVQDAYLVSKMDREHYVDVSVIADFKMVKQLTDDGSVILEALKASSKITLDGDGKRMRPTVVNARTTLILRNIPTDTPEDDVRKFVKEAGVGTVVSIRADVGDNWFVTLETEEAAKQALEAVKPLKWEGKSIGCAIKSESLLKGITPGSPPKGANGAFVPNYGAGGAVQFGYTYPQGGDAGQGGFRQGSAGGGRAGGRRGPGGPGQVKSNGVPSGAEGSEGGQRKAGKKNKARGGREGGKEGGSPVGGVEKEEVKPQPPLKMNMADFPELETKGGVPRPVAPVVEMSGGKSIASIVANGVPKPPAVAEKEEKKEKAASLAAHVNAVAEPQEANGPTISSGSSSSSAADSSPSPSPSGDAVAAALKPKKMSYAQMAQMNGTAAPSLDAKPAVAAE